jgi:hypothetical protein
MVKVLSPDRLRKDLAETVGEMKKLYEIHDDTKK